MKELFPNRPDLVVHDDALYRTIYSVDASIFEVMPTCVLIPHSKEALIEVVKVCFEHQIPMTVRGAATGIAGSAIGAGAVIDVTFLNHLIALDVERLQVTLEPGMVQDNLNDLLKPYSLRLGPDTSSGNRATIGGMLGCNASGARSLKFGPMVDAVKSLRLLLDDGTEILLETVTAAEFIMRQKLPGKEGLLYRHLAALRDDFLQFSQPLWPKRRSSGYRLEELLQEDELCLAKLVVGAEGTLGIITEVTLSLVPDLNEQSIYLYHFETVEEALVAISPLLNQKLTSLELIDNHIIQIARALPRYQQISWLQGGVFLAVEMDACAHHQPLNSAKSMKCLKTPEEQALFWEVRKNGLGLLLSRRSFSRAAAFLEDLVVPTHSLKPFYQALCHLLGDRLKETGVYGHAGEGCLHIRPFVNLDSESDLEWMKELMYETAKLVRSFDGVLSGEHGDGRIRSWLFREQFGPEWQRAFERLKECFDPHNLFNPGIKVEGSFKHQNLRKSLSHTKEPLTFLDFSNEGGIALSVDLCNGNGACRKSTGVMCPSFQASGEEFDSTRARAKALTAALYHEDGFALDELKEVLDRCLSCKGCLSDCPSQVDMAKLKAEVSWAYYQKNGASLRDQLFARLPLWLPILAALPFNRFFQQVFAGPLGSLLGISPKRALPQLAPRRFSELVRGRHFRKGVKRIALFIDTFTEFYQPHVGIHALELFEQLGVEVRILSWSCCGRPAYSKGVLDKAKRSVLKLKEHFQQVDSGVPIVVLEPSCASMLIEDTKGLLGVQEAAAFASVVPYSKFILDQVKSPLVAAIPVLHHTHCHARSLWGDTMEIKAIQALGFSVTSTQAGCCGMAGSFGYETEHESLSCQIAELAFIPQMKKGHAEGLLLSASGFSCREQLAHLAQIEALHPVSLFFRSTLVE